MPDGCGWADKGGQAAHGTPTTAFLPEIPKEPKISPKIPSASYCDFDGFAMLAAGSKENGGLPPFFGRP